MGKKRGGARKLPEVTLLVRVEAIILLLRYKGKLDLVTNVP